MASTNTPSFVVKSTTSLVNDVLSRLLRAFAEEATPTGRDTLTDINPGSILRTLTEAICEEMGYDPDDTTNISIYNQLVNVYNSGFIDYAEGSALDNVVAILGVERKAAAKSSGTITFIRTTVPSGAFIIPIGTVVTTEFSASADSVEFDTTALGTWSVTITDEAITFDELVDEYPCAQKFMYSIQSVWGTKYDLLDYDGAEVATPTVPHTAYYLSSLDLVTVPVIPSVIKAAGVEFSTADYTKINTSNDLRAEHSGSTDIDNYEYYLFEFDVTTYIDDIANIVKIIPRFEGYGNADSSGGFECFMWNKTDLDWDSWGDTTTAIDGATEETIENLSIANSQSECANYVDGNKKVWLLVQSYGKTAGATPSASILGCDYVRIGVSEQEYTFVADTDYELMQSSESTSGYDVVNWLVGDKPEDGTEFYVSYTPLSLDIAISASIGGDSGNVGLNKITVIKSALSDIDSCNNYTGAVGGGDIESDADLRYRAKNALQALGKATVLALKFSILDISGVRDVSIDDTPLVNVYNEDHTYNTGTSLQSLNEDGIESLSDITGTVSGGAYTFVEDTDYSLDSDGKTLEWLTAGTKPDDGTIYYVDYIYNQKGVVNALVLGNTIPMSAVLLAEIETEVDATKAAGIIVNIQEPSFVAVDITGEVIISAGSSWTEIKPLIEDELRAYINALDIGEDVIHSELVYAAQSVSGVYDVTISTPPTNVSVPSDEIVTTGTITLTNAT